MRLRRFGLVAVLIAAFGLVVSATAALAYAPTGGDFITCVAGGDTNVECVAGVFEEGCPGTFEVTDESGAVIDSGATTPADVDGEVTFDFDVPVDQSDGDLTVTVQCGGKILSDVVANVNAGEVIANAGADSGVIAVLAIAAISGGAIVLLISRRRTHAKST